VLFSAPVGVWPAIQCTSTVGHSMMQYFLVVLYLFALDSGFRQVHWWPIECMLMIYELLYT